MTQTFESRDYVACITRTNDIDKALVEIIFQISYQNRGICNEGGTLQDCYVAGGISRRVADYNVRANALTRRQNMQSFLDNSDISEGQNSIQGGSQIHNQGGMDTLPEVCGFEKGKSSATLHRTHQKPPFRALIFTLHNQPCY